MTNNKTTAWFALDDTPGLYMGNKDSVIYTDSNVGLSEYEYLKPNDILYVRPVKAKQFSFAQFPYGVVFTVISSTILIVTFIQANNNSN